MSVLIERPGLLTTVQDMGRAGHAAEGYAECGACDAFSYQLAVLLCGGPEGSAVLEATLVGPVLRPDEDTVCAVVGSRPLLNGLPVPTCAPLLLHKGDVLDAGPCDRLRGYVAFHGGAAVPPVLGSRSTDLKCHLGGHEGRALKAGDRLPLLPCPGAAELARGLQRRLRGLVLPWLPFPEAGPVPIRAIRGPQDARFSVEQLDRLFSQTWQVSAKSDRMGLRLEGEPLPLEGGTDILSDGILAGSVQIAAGGLPIVMLADHQTTGGYAKPCTVVPQDLPLLAQLRPGMTLRFVETDLSSAAHDLRARAALMKDL